jgi:hypothetical protein
MKRFLLSSVLIASLLSASLTSNAQCELTDVAPAGATGATNTFGTNAEGFTGNVTYDATNDLLLTNAGTGVRTITTPIYFRPPGLTGNIVLRFTLERVGGATNTVSAYSVSLTTNSGTTTVCPMEAPTVAISPNMPSVYYITIPSSVIDPGVNFQFNINLTVGGQYRFDNFGANVATAAGTLPVRFGDVKATHSSNGVSLQWSNLSESDVASYTIERSSNGRGFAQVAQVYAAKNDGGKASYQQVDAAPLNGTSYYRIKAVETNGKTVYSDIIRMNIDGGTASLLLYPNPVRGKTLTLSLNNLAAGKYTVRIYNNTSQVVSNQALDHSGGSLTETVAITTLKPGVYTLEVSGGVKLQKQFVIQ